MLNEVNASTKNWMLEIGGGQDRCVGRDGLARAVCHPVRSETQAVGEGFRTWGELRKFQEAAKEDRHVR